MLRRCNTSAAAPANRPRVLDRGRPRMGALGSMQVPLLTERLTRVASAASVGAAVTEMRSTARTRWLP
jgi:hypothetical protein